MKPHLVFVPADFTVATLLADRLNCSATTIADDDLFFYVLKYILGGFTRSAGFVCVSSSFGFLAAVQVVGGHFPLFSQHAELWFQMATLTFKFFSHPDAARRCAVWLA